MPEDLSAKGRPQANAGAPGMLAIVQHAARATSMGIPPLFSTCAKPLSAAPQALRLLLAFLHSQGTGLRDRRSSPHRLLKQKGREVICGHALPLRCRLQLLVERPLDENGH